jgi:hypothetical protein
MVINLLLRWNWNDSVSSPCLFTTSADGSTLPALNEKLRKKAGVTGKENTKCPPKKICPSGSLVTKIRTCRTALNYYLLICLYLHNTYTCRVNLLNKANLVYNLFLVYSFLVHLSISACFGRLCAHHQEKQLCLCDTWYLLFCMDDWYAGCIPDNHLHRVTNTKCRIDTVISLNDVHIFARNMWRKYINIVRKNYAPSWLQFTRL